MNRAYFYETTNLPEENKHASNPAGTGQAIQPLKNNFIQMKQFNGFICVLVLAFISISAYSQTNVPQTEISNGLIKALIYLPDSVNGYYRGTRFDWSGNMPALTYYGHEYFGKWFDKYSPEIHDAIMGPVEEFTALDYPAIKPGDNFVKIGVGVLVKPDDKPYSISRAYPVINRGKWKVKKHSDAVQFTHQLNNKDFSYQYKKTIQLIKGKPQMVISHVLKNTGKKTIETSVYDHNFFIIDKQPVGEGLSFTFPFNITGEGLGLKDIARVEGNQILFLRNLSAGENVYCGSLGGFGQSVKDFDIRIENRITGGGVRITSDQPLMKLVFWSCPATACSEPYIKIKVEPGKEFKWNLIYDFYTLSRK
jgi:hypothetical protein